MSPPPKRPHRTLKYSGSSSRKAIVIVKHRTEQLALRAADVFFKRCQQVSGAEGRQRACKAEDAELHICHAFGADVDLHTKPHKPNLLKYAGEQGIQQMCALVNEVVGGERRQDPDVLPHSF